MTNYAYYDAKDDVVIVDFTGLRVTPELFREIHAQALAVIASLPKKVYALICWKDATFEENMPELYGELSAELLSKVKGIIRYEANVAVTNITIRGQTIKRRTQGTHSYIFATKEEALEAVRQRRAEEEEQI